MAFPRIAIESLPPVLIFLVRESDQYITRRAWGAFDSLKVRAIDDLYFAPDADLKIIYGFSSEPPHASNVTAVSVPLQVALERVFFHTTEPAELVLNRRGDWVGAPLPQQEVECSVPDDFEPCARILRDEIPELIGALACGSRAERDPLNYAANALRRGAFFECYYAAKKARLLQPKNQTAWFYELFSYSFFAEAEDALNAYEEYPDRGSSEPMAQLLAARYRLLLKQFNEARTILHTLSFNPDLGALATCEMARSYVLERYYTRAIDLAANAIERDPTLIEGYLLRGIAARGLAYDAGDSEGLNEAYKDFEKVVKSGGYATGEALYHAGTVCARLGALPEAEQAFRQALFQRDRLSPRDALIRVLCARNEISEASTELTVFESLAPKYPINLRQQLAQVLIQSESLEAQQERSGSQLWGNSIAESVVAASKLMRQWGILLTDTLSDCVMLDDLINRYAPDGDFPTEGEFSALHHTGHEAVARVLSLYISNLLVQSGRALWSPESAKSCGIISERDRVEIPVENFVKERLLLGASGDNFSALESLVVEMDMGLAKGSPGADMGWWKPASLERLRYFKEEAEWTADMLSRLGMGPSRTLSDLEGLDAWIDSMFEPGGMLAPDMKGRIPVDMDRFIVGLGLFVGETIASNSAQVWFDHEKPEGISILSHALGRLFPVARMQRRVYLASAADFSAKLGSLAWSVAVASVTEELQRGALKGADSVKRTLIERLPSIATFPETELLGVVDSLIIGASLRVQGERGIDS